ncbi:MAG TPA: hypothetical protein PLQ81_14965, partial [bacterium]|nr:hypothetical protein [bacterium]
MNSLVFDKTYYLGINVNNGGELMPRSKINYSMYSIKALYSDTAATAFFLGANAVGTGNLTITDTFSVNNVFIVRKDGKVGINTLAPSEQLEIGGKVKASHFIGDGSQLSGIVSSGIIDASITSAHIKNGELANEDIADNANINPSKIDTALIRLGNNQMLANINAEKIGDGTISNSEFGYLDGVTSSIQNQLNSISMDTAGLLNRITNLESDSANTENRLSGLESDSANTENRISVIENLQTSMNDTFYNKGQVDNYIKLLSSDTHLLKNSISDYKTNVENETIHIYSLLNSLGTDTNSLKSDLTSYRFVVHADTLMIYNWLNSLSADTSALKSELSSFKIQVNNETASINSRVNNIHSEINDSFALKSNLNNPVFTGL